MNLTKKLYCELTLRAIARTECGMDLPIKLEDIPKSIIFKSSTAAICMEELGLLDGDVEAKAYVATRGGVALVSSDEMGEPSIVSFRTLLEAFKE